MAAPVREKRAEAEAEGGGLDDVDPEALPSTPVRVTVGERVSREEAEKETVAEAQGDAEAGCEGEMETLPQALVLGLARGLRVATVAVAQEDTIPLRETSGLADGEREGKLVGDTEGEAGLGVRVAARESEGITDSLGGSEAETELDALKLGCGVREAERVLRALPEDEAQGEMEERGVVLPIVLAEDEGVRVARAAVAEDAKDAVTLAVYVSSELPVGVALDVPLPLRCDESEGSAALPEAVTLPPPPLLLEHAEASPLREGV